MSYQTEGLRVFFSTLPSLLNFELKVRSYGHLSEASLVKTFHPFEKGVFWTFPYPALVKGLIRR
uniref:Putative ovule protein n=1 Tax=Solanum chacoense TaxID=4108 RepID=A0A0V0H1B9_SOLCH